MSKAQNRRPVDVARLLDRSRSMIPLTATVLDTFEAYQEAMSRDMPGSLIRRALFNEERFKLDQDFVDPWSAQRLWPLCDFYTHHKINFGLKGRRKNYTDGYIVARERATRQQICC